MLPLTWVKKSVLYILDTTYVVNKKLKLKVTLTFEDKKDHS